MNKYVYYGPFKTYIKEFIELKQAIGYKYFSEAGHLKRFDTFTLDKYPSSNVLTKEIIMDWCTKKSYEKQENLCSRASIIRKFAMYIDNLGYNAYIIPKKYFKSGEKYIPHIYTDNELKEFFKETDKCNYCSEFPYRHIIMPILFRLIYSCGLRVSEARLLKVKDVDLNTGILTINHSKKDNSQLVPMIDDKPMTITNVYQNFRRFLWKNYRFS